MTSHGYGLRLFPIWAALRSSEPAFFTTLRAKGAFLVTATYDPQQPLPKVVNVSIVSEVGMPCRLLSPWANTTAIVVSRRGGGATVAVAVGADGWATFQTVRGGKYNIEPA